MAKAHVLIIFVLSIASGLRFVAKNELPCTVNKDNLLSSMKERLIEKCKADVKKGATTIGGCEAEVDAVVDDGHFNVWARTLLRPKPFDTPTIPNILTLWYGLPDAKRYTVLRQVKGADGFSDEDLVMNDFLNTAAEAVGCSEVDLVNALSQAYWNGASSTMVQEWIKRLEKAGIKSPILRVVVAVVADPDRGKIFWRHELPSVAIGVRRPINVEIFDLTGHTKDHRLTTLGESVRSVFNLYTYLSTQAQGQTQWFVQRCVANATTCDAKVKLGPTAEQGGPEAQCRLGYMYLKGLGVGRDYAKARTLFQKAANKGHAVAQHNLGKMYSEGWGVSRDLVKARELYQMAADKGDANAQNSLGSLYLRGLGGSRNDAKARKLFQNAAGKGHTLAQINLDIMNDKSLGVSRDFVKARKLYQLAADEGDANAQNSLGSLYIGGLGGSRNFAKARELYQKAAYQGNEAAKKNLAFMNRESLGVGDDYRKIVVGAASLGSVPTSPTFEPFDSGII